VPGVVHGVVPAVELGELGLPAGEHGPGQVPGLEHSTFQIEPPGHRDHEPILHR
jgi:hypothetical protein